MEFAQRLKDRVVLLTGATGGIGSAIATRLGREGATVILGYQEKAAAAEKLQTELAKAGIRAAALQLDVGSAASVKQAIGTALKLHGRIDVLVNNAGVLRNGSIDQFTDDEWELTFRVNVKGPTLCAREVAGAMKAAGRGAIINIASRFALLGAPNSLAYGASKAALVNVTKALAKHYAPVIRVNAVAPAYTLTALTAKEPPTFLASFVEQVPLHRAATPDDTAAAVAYLASDDAAFVTGQTIYVDGGFTVR